MGNSLIARARARAYQAYTRLGFGLAARYRPLLARTTFVGVTGSCGKTTTKNLVAAVLARRGRVTLTPGTHNAGHWVPRTLLSARPGDAYYVQEFGAMGPGSLDAPIALVRPRVAVVTNVGGDHRSAFRDIELTAAEKRKLVEAVPADGIAVLNADDPRVLGMAGACRGRVITFGVAQAADVRAERVTSVWPAHLSFVVRHGAESAIVGTRFNGVHFAHACLAAIATGLALGVPLEDAVAAVSEVEPWPGRLSEVTVDGVTFIRDEVKSPLWTVAPALDFLRTAQASRRVAVIGTISDFPGAMSRAYSSAARLALDAADEVIFVGRQAERAAGARSHPRGAELRMFTTPREASAYLARTLRPGDLVLLKGSQRADHLLRLIQARRDEVVCWRANCHRLKFCDQCLLRRVPELRVPRLGRIAMAPTEAVDA